MLVVLQPFVSYLWWNQIDFVEKEKEWFLLAQAILLSFLVSGVFWISGIKNFDNDVSLVDGFHQVSFKCLATHVVFLHVLIFFVVLLSSNLVRLC